MKMFSQKRDFSKILTIIDILQNFCPISRLSTISTKIEIIENFDQNGDFQIFCPQPEIIAKNADKKIQKQKKIDQNQDISENVDQFRDFQNILTEIEIFYNFYQKWDFPVFFFFFLPKSTFLEILTKIEMLKYVDQHRNCYFIFWLNSK